MIVLKNSVFYDIPKTGGSWVSEGLVWYHIGKPTHGTSHQPPGKEHPDKIKFTFIRHPVEWYRSYYASIVDKSKERPKFSKWLREMYAGKSAFDRKWTTLTDYYKKFLKCDFVGKTENLKQDLRKVLKMAGEPISNEILDRPKVNQSRTVITPSKEDVKLIKENEKYIIKRYYS